MVRKLMGISEIAIIGVLLFHTTGWGFTAMFAWTDRYLAFTGSDFSQVGSPAYYFLRFIEQLVAFVIPAFLFVSGYFVAIATGRSQATIGWRTVGARIKTLLIPYLIWTGVLWCFMYIDGRTLSVTGYVEALLTGRTNPAYYYVPLLISFYLLSPILVYWAKTKWALLLIGAALIQLTVQLLYYPALLGIDMGTWQPFIDVVPKWFFPARIFWFCLGIVTGFYLSRFQSLLRQYRWHLLFFAIVLFCTGLIEWEKMVDYSGQPLLANRDTFVDTMYALSVIFCFLSFDMFYLPLSGALGGLNSKAYGIYLTHSPVMEVVARAVYLFVPALLARQFIFQPLIFTAGLVVPLLMMAFVNRSPWRRYYRYLYG